MYNVIAVCPIMESFLSIPMAGIGFLSTINERFSDVMECFSVIGNSAENIVYSK